MRYLGEFEILQSFLTVAEELNFRRAAERLNINQSALTRRIQNLEWQLGFKLFHRSTRKVTLTEAGKVFYEENFRIVSTLRSSVEKARRVASGESGRLRIGYMAFATTEVLPKAVRAFGQRYPHVNVDVAYYRTQAQKLALARNEIDAGFIIGPFEHPDFEAITVSSERLYAVLPMNHWLATRPGITLEDLAGCRFVLGTMQEWDFYRWRINDIFHARGLGVQTSFEPSDTLGILGLVAAGLGITVYPEGIMRFQPRRVVVKRIEDCPETIDTMLAWHRSAPLPHLQRFVQVCKEVFLNGPEVDAAGLQDRSLSAMSHGVPISPS